MIAEDILLQSRYILSDEDKTRWSDSRLLSLLNNGITNIATKTIVFVETKFYVVQNLLVDIDFTDVSTKILRAEYLDEPLPFFGFEEMDDKDRDWQLETGDKVKAIVYNKQRNGLLKQYPIVENAQNDHIEYNSLYGITTDISYSDIQPTLGDVYGDVSSVPDDALIKFYYIRKHAKLVDISDELIIDELVENPLIHFIAGMALRDNQDTQNRQMANEEMNMYEVFLEQYDIEKSKLFVRTNNNVGYRPND